MSTFKMPWLTSEVLFSQAKHVSFFGQDFYFQIRYVQDTDDKWIRYIDVIDDCKVIDITNYIEERELLSIYSKRMVGREKPHEILCFQPTNELNKMLAIALESYARKKWEDPEFNS